MDLTEILSPALFNERSVQRGLSTGVAADLETSWNLETNHGVTNAAASCESQDKSLDSKSTVAIVFEVAESQMMGAQFHWSRERVKSSQHDLTSFLLCANAVNRCIVVSAASSNIHRTRHHGMKRVFRSSLFNQVFVEN